MAGIQLTQTGGAGIINAGGAQNPSPFTTVITGIGATLAIVGTVPTSFAWSVAAPRGSKVSLDNPSASTPTLPNFDFAGIWTIQCQDQAGTVYTLQLIVQKRATAQRGQPIAPAYVAASQVDQPNFGETLFADAGNAGHISAKDSAGATAPLAQVKSGTTGQRPTTGLYPGFTYFDTSLGAAGKPIWRDKNNAAWIDATGATV